MMRGYIALVAGLFFATTTLSAQVKHRAELQRYNTRESLEVGGVSSDNGKFLELGLEVDSVRNNHYISYFTYPALWSDDRVMLHMQSAPEPYTLYVNGEEICTIEDAITPQQIDITAATTQSENRVDIITHAPLWGEPKSDNVTPFAGSYIYAQSAVAITDYRVRLNPSKSDGEALFTLEMEVANNYPFDYSMEVGFDIYDPSGKILDYYFTKQYIAARGVDTVRFEFKIAAPDHFRWGVPAPRLARKSQPTTQSPLYTLTMYTREGSVLRDYIEAKVGYTDFKVEDGAITNFGEPITIDTATVNHAGTKEATKKLFGQLQKSGVTTLLPEFAQPNYYYELATEMGLFVVDAVSIGTSPEADNRAVGGAPANNPALVEEYLSRGKTTYHRSTNYPAVIAYSLGGDSGVGYNIYRLYEMLKSIEQERPIIYKGARGEWATDEINGLGGAQE